MNCSLQIINADVLYPSLLRAQQNQTALKQILKVQNLTFIKILQVWASYWCHLKLFSVTCNATEYFRKYQGNICATAVVKAPFDKTRSSCWQTGEGADWLPCVYSPWKRLLQRWGNGTRGRGQTNRKGKKPGLHIQQWRETMKAVRTWPNGLVRKPHCGLYYSSIQIFR